MMGESVTMVADSIALKKYIAQSIFSDHNGTLEVNNRRKMGKFTKL